MRKEIYVTGLDIGSSKTTALLARSGRDGAFEILGQVSLPSRGLSRGLLVDLGEAADSVSKALTKLHEKTRIKSGDIYVNISGQSVKGSKTVGMIPIAHRGREIVRPDMERCVTVASTIHLPFDREIVDKIVHKFSVDDQPWIRNPLGLYASRLSCEAYIITADVNQIQSIYKCVNDAGYDVKELVYSGIADGAALLDDAEREGGSVIIDIGDSLTEVSIFTEGTLAQLDIIPIGSRDLPGDFRQSQVFDSIVLSMSAKIQEFVRSGGRVSSVILTGGMVFSDGLIEYLEGRLPYPIKMGHAKDVRGEISSIEGLRLSTAIGLARYGYEKEMRKISEKGMGVRRISDKIVDIFNNYF